jgi:hypothetical protein
MESEKQFWQLGEFSRLIDKHYTLINNWFKALEDKRIHYVTRIDSGEKVYDQLDLAIAKYIVTKREEKWSLNAIYDDLSNHFELRPFPEGHPETSTAITDIRALENLIIANVTKEVIQQMTALLPPPVDERASRQQRITDRITERRVDAELESEALKLWQAKPEEERLIKTGFFRKSENIEAKQRFIKAYINEHFQERMEREYGLSEEDTQG